MKTKFIVSACALVCLAFIGLIACSEKEEAVEQPAEVVTPQNTITGGGGGGVCCSITCSNGSSCSAGISPCTCKCDWAGDAKCTGGATQFGVSGPSSLSAYYDGLNALLSSFGKPYADQSIIHLTEIKVLFEMNAYNINNPGDIGLYHQHVDQLELLEPQFTSNELSQIEAYKSSQGGGGGGGGG